MSKPQFWQLSDFASLLNVHYTTVNDWYNMLEDKRIHYVNRTAKSKNSKRVYDELDLKVGKAISRLRDEKWSLDAICNVLQDEIDEPLRPFPDDYENEDKGSQLSIELIRDKLGPEFTRLLLEEMNKQRELMRMEMSEVIQNLLPKSTDTHAENQKRITDMITTNRISKQLQIEALDEWSKLPESERYQKVGLFRKEEDTTKRERFIREYENKHFEDRLRKEIEE